MSIRITHVHVDHTTGYITHLIFQSQSALPITLPEYRHMIGITNGMRSSERLPAGSQPNSDLVHFDATQQYRAERLKHVEAPFLNRSIPFQLFCTVYPEIKPQNVERNHMLMKNLIREAQQEFKSTMRYAYCFERFPGCTDIHTHIALASDAPLNIEWFRSYSRYFYPDVNMSVLPYENAVPYMLKQTNVILVNCDVYLKAPSTSRERRRLKRMKDRGTSE